MSKDYPIFVETLFKYFSSCSIQGFFADERALHLFKKYFINPRTLKPENINKKPRWNKAIRWEAEIP